MSEPNPDVSAVARKLAMFDDLRQAERRAVSSRVAAVIAHLIGTPLHVIAGRASLIRGAPNEPSVEENARRIEEQVERLARRIRALIDYLTAPDSVVAEESVESVLDAALSLYDPVAAERGVKIHRLGDPCTEPRIDGTSALVVLTSLLSLATRIAPRGSACNLGATTAGDGKIVFELTVPGLEPPNSRLDTLEPPDQLESSRIEELQVLSVCSAIARRSGGSIEVTRSEPSPATIRYVIARLA